MTLLFCDSFDHYTTILQKWDGTTGSGGFTPFISTGRFGNGLYVQASGGNFGYVEKKFTSGTPSTVIIGFALYGNVFNTDLDIVQFRENTTVHVTLRRNSSGQFYFTRNGTAIGSPSVNSFVNGVWWYVEVKLNIHDSTGTVELRVNNGVEITGTGLDTKNGGTGYVDTISFHTNSTAHIIDDLYCCDNAGSVNNNFLGDIRVQALLPSGNGNSSQLVGSDSNSTDNYLLVDEAAPDGDTTYVESSTPGDKDTYAYGNLSATSGTVLGVQILPYAKKTDAGARSICSVARLSSTEVDSADKVLGTSYQYQPDIRETKPGGGAWTISDVNSAEFGVKVTA